MELVVHPDVNGARRLGVGSEQSIPFVNPVEDAHSVEAPFRSRVHEKVGFVHVLSSGSVDS